MTRVATPQNEDYLVNIARSGTAAHLERLLRLYRQCERRREMGEALVKHENRSLRCQKLGDGSLFLEGRLPPDLAAVFLKAFESALDALREREWASEGEEGDAGGSARDADAGEARERSAERSPGGAPAARSEPSAWIQDVNRRRERDRRNADALMAMAETMLAHGPAAVDAGERYEVLVHVDERTLPVDGDGPAPELEDGTPLAAETVRRIACDCSRVCVHEDESGEILNVGRRTRQIPPAIRRALRVRDRGCAFPGCANRRFVDGHHIQHWADGGETKLSNLVLLCGPHHTLVHEGDYRVERAGLGFVFVRPDGVRLVPPPLGGEGFLRSAERLAAEHEAAGIRIDARTVTPEWYGERPIWSWAVESLQRRGGAPD